MDAGSELVAISPASRDQGLVVRGQRPASRGQGPASRDQGPGAGEQGAGGLRGYRGAADAADSTLKDCFGQRPTPQPASSMTHLGCIFW